MHSIGVARGAEEAVVPIITISRGSFSGGKTLAEAVAKKLGYRCIGREHIVHKATLWGVSENDLHEALDQPPAFFGQSAHVKYKYLALIQSALADETRDGKAVYHGHAAHVLLGKGAHVLRVRIIAPMEYRIEKVQKKQKCTRKEAIAYIEKIDNERHKWTKFLYGLEWTDAGLYDLVLNLEQMGLDEACDCICHAARLKCFTPESPKRLEDFAMACKVKAKLAMDAGTADCEFEVEADDGAVMVKGEIVSPNQAKRIGTVARSVAGVKKLDLGLKIIARIEG